MQQYILEVNKAGAEDLPFYTLGIGKLGGFTWKPFVWPIDHFWVDPIILGGMLKIDCLNIDYR